jgi:serine/threonine-protein kinase ULK/ATG1
MEYASVSLADFMKRRHTLGAYSMTLNSENTLSYCRQMWLNEMLTRHFLRQMCNALNFLGKHSLVHTEIQPNNILIFPPTASRATDNPETDAFDHFDNQPDVFLTASLPTFKIADLGCARCMPSRNVNEDLSGFSVYLAPEVVREEEYDTRADLWSLGMVLGHLAVGKAPFRACDKPDYLRRVTSDRVNAKVSANLHLRVNEAHH